MKVLPFAALLALVQAPAGAEMVKVNGIDLHYDVAGAGEPLILLHGFGSCASDWSKTAAVLAKKYKVISVDARGHGRSTNPSDKFEHAQAAEDVRALLDELKIENARAIGFSSGGITLLHLATRHPTRLSKMVVIGATTRFPDQAREILQSVSTDTLPPEVLEGFRTCATRGEPQVQSIVSQFRALGFSVTDTNLQPADLAKIKARTLIVHGDRDIFFPVEIPVATYRSIKTSELWIVPNGDHSPTAGASTEDFLRKVEAFLAN